MQIKFSDLPNIRRKHKNKDIVFIRGPFDLIHAGHIELLRLAKMKGDILVVALARDSDLAARKGKGRPVLKMWQRKRVMDAIRYVNYVVTLPVSKTREQNKQATFTVLKALRPDIFATVYKIWKKYDVEMRRKYGTKVTLIKEVRLNSTTAIIKRAAVASKNANTNL